MQIKELAKHVYSSSSPLAINTMFAVAAYTGARRSEMPKSQTEGSNYEDDIMTIQEKERVRSSSALVSGIR